jgi:hypothetical protein
LADDGLERRIVAKDDQVWNAEASRVDLETDFRQRANMEFVRAQSTGTSVPAGIPSILRWNTSGILIRF